MRGRSRCVTSGADRLVRLEKHVEFLEAERGRLERLLASALRVAVGGTTTNPSALLDLLCELDGRDATHAAFLEERGA